MIKMTLDEFAYKLIEYSCINLYNIGDTAELNDIRLMTDDKVVCIENISISLLENSDDNKIGTVIKYYDKDKYELPQTIIELGCNESNSFSIFREDTKGIEYLESICPVEDNSSILLKIQIINFYPLISLMD